MDRKRTKDRRKAKELEKESALKNQRFWSPQIHEAGRLKG